MGNHHSKKRNKSNYIEKLSSYNVESKEEYEEDEHIIHVLYREVFKKNFSSPVKDILSDSNTRVLDIGCGSGFWLIEMAADFPKPKYVGIDVAPVFPKSTYPSNIEFFQHNFLEGLPYEDNTFDFVHMQGLVFDITKTQWETFVYQELARVLKPGGWLEICDPQVGMINPGPTLKKLQDALCDHFLSNHIDPFLPLRHHLLLKSIPRFSSSTVYHENGVLPVGSYAGNFGKLGGRHIRIFSKNAYQSKIGRNMNVKQKDIESNLDIIEREFDIYKSYFNVHRYYVQKMAEDESCSVKMKYPSKFR